MIVDLHSHYPMHLVPAARGTPLDAITTREGRSRVRDRVRALLLGLASRFGNYRSFAAGPRVTVSELDQGDVRVALSVLYSFFDEVDIGEPYGAGPQDEYLARLLRQLEHVEEHVRSRHEGRARIARTPAEVDEAVAAGEVALVHCVEGGFHLGETPDAVDAAVVELARRGVAYVTLAHLFWRGVATNAPAIPFLPDAVYRRIFGQPHIGLTDLGRAAVRAMAREGVLVDLSHMTGRALDDTLDLLDEIGSGTPVLASHSVYRFGGQEYALDDAAVQRIAARDGVIGLILAQHQLNDGLRRRRTKRFAESVHVIGRHIDRIAEITGSHRHAAIGTDLDGFIKPTAAGLDSARDLRHLEHALHGRYGPSDGEAICSGNALRVLRAGWRGAR